MVNGFDNVITVSLDIALSLYLALVVDSDINNYDAGSFEMEPLCGRPKGMKVDKDGFLIVLDSSKGMLKVNPKTGTIQTVIPTSTGMEDATR
ncbi:hypothetical protein KUTeg_020534 [Tegillarca granosa]|uniref:Adipocyte plasma membrane-associated protein n=1 Tax=Tegillarca granosa TaxID=220873 RepID=A0ABQ9ECE0_TEGGR|nr:hypothetical protein KUTeg_020534 [Tegillarca granosa]